jgi:tRNA1Val (adenine37-N6)-methyltransferase
MSMDIALTDDALFNGRLRLWQPREGYRFSVDAPLLVWFASRFGRVRAAVDLGAGCGVVGLGLLAANTAATAAGVEIQPDLARLAEQNAARNGLADRYLSLARDMGQLRDERRWRGAFDLVVVNPPFWPRAHGHLPESEQRRVACHEVAIDLDGWVHAAGGLLRPRRGRLCAVFPARRLGALLAALKAHGLTGETLLAVHPREGVPAELVLISARPGVRDRLTLEPPLVLGDDAAGDAPAVAAILGGSFSAALAARPDTRPVN